MKESFLYIFLHYASGIVEDKDGFYSFRVIYGASICDHKIRDYVTGSSVHHSTSNDSIREYRLYNSEKLISIDSLFDPSNKFVDSEGKLKIEMKVNFLKYLISGWYTGLNFYKSIYLMFQIFREEFYYFYKERIYCDFTIGCSDGVELPVHRIILAKISPIFKSMFDADSKGSKSNKLIISDIDSTTMEEVIKFCYGEDNATRNAAELLKMHYVAEKYEVCGLEDLCIDLLMHNIDAKNVLNVFVDADFYGIKCIEVQCLAIIIE